MFEVRDDMVVCGVYKVDDEYFEIYCDEDGVCYYEDNCGAWIISELNVEKPMEIRTPNLIKAVEDGVYGDCIGVLYTTDHGKVYVFKDTDFFAVRNITALKDDIETHMYDTFDYNED